MPGRAASSDAWSRSPSVLLSPLSSAIDAHFCLVACARVSVARPSQAIYKASKTRRVIKQAEDRRLQNRIKHSAPGSVKVKPERKKKLVAELE